MNGALGRRGFTLIELVVVIVLTGIVATLVARNVSQPILSFIDSARRAALVDANETALNRVTREVRLALPNSVRIAGGRALEFLRTRTGGRYRAEVDPAASSPGLDLDFTATRDTFAVLGQIKEFGRICTGAGNCGGGSPTGTAACMADDRVDCLVIFNTGQPADCSTLASGRTNAYCGDNVAGIERVDVAARTIEFIHDRPGGFSLAS